MPLKSILIVLLFAFCSSAYALSIHLTKTVHQQKSMYRNIIVAEGNGTRCMTFGRRNALQTCIRLEQPQRLMMPYTRGLFAGLFANPQAQRILVIGLGGGVIPKAMRHIDPTMQIDVVELDPAVVEVAKQYFGYREDARMRTFVSDGRVFVRAQRRAAVHYDLVIIDAYEKVYVPEHMLTQEFISEVKSLLTPGGVIAANTFSRGALSQYEAATYQSVFGATQIVDVEGLNRIILAGRDGLPSLSAMKHNASLMQDKFAKIGVSTDELVSVLSQQAKATGVRPLTDQFSPANLLFDY